MKNVMTSFCLIFMISILLTNCKNKKEFNDATTNINSNDTLNNNYHSNERQLIHTATMDLKVENSLNVTRKFEEKVIELKGFILQSHINRITNKTIESVISVDSIKQIEYYQLKGNLVVRVPDTSLHQLLEFAQTIDAQVITRKIDGTDVTFALKENEYLQNNLTEQISDTNKSEKAALKNEKVEKKMESLKWKDDLNFSTISINLEQPEAYSISNIVNNEANWAKETSILSKTWYSIQKGFYQFMSVISFLLQFWWLAPLFILGKIAYKKLFILFEKVKLESKK